LRIRWPFGRRQKEEIKEIKKEGKQREEYYDEKAAKGWMPKHHEPIPESATTERILSVTEASRLHKAKDVTVKGILSGIQPLRKMIKGISTRCLKCNTLYERKYDKPELFESLEPINRIKKCPNCKTGDFFDIFRPDQINAVVAELKDQDTFSEIDPLGIIVFGDDEPAFDDTRDIERHLGEAIEVIGDIYTIGKSRRDSMAVAYLYVKYPVKYLSRPELELTSEDVKAIKRFVDRVGPDKIVDRLTEMFATSVIGYNSVKKGLLLCATSTSIDKKIKKLHTILVGDVGLAKSELLKNAVEIVPGSRYENIQFATGKSLTAIVSKDEGYSIKGCYYS
jgi:DNA replicative helicase MCM subunit Mcm2 (Cdc46/Mcm family)